MQKADVKRKAEDWDKDHNDDFEVDKEYLVTAIRHREVATYRNDHNRITSDFSADDETVHDYGGRFVWELFRFPSSQIAWAVIEVGFDRSTAQGLSISGKRMLSDSTA